MDCDDSVVAFPVIDSHIHLYAASHLLDLAWVPNLPERHVLKQQNSVDQYRAISRGQYNLRGFVFVETDRESSLDEDGWRHAAEEVEFLRRIKSGKPIEGEGHLPEDKTLILGAVVWAPIGGPVDQLQKYLEKIGAIEDLRSQNGLIRGFRYLLQDKPKGTALRNDFLKGLLLLERIGARTFDIGVDFQQGGPWQLQDVVELLQKFHRETRSSGKLKFVINHLCKPNLRSTDDKNAQAEDFENWRWSIFALSTMPNTYMKLSGLFSQFDPQEVGQPVAVSDLLEQSRPYMETIFECFGPVGSRGKMRIMFGSDWPVCNVGGPGPEYSWQHWTEFVRVLLDDQGLVSEEHKASVWAGCAKEVYGLNVDLDPA